MSNPSLGLISHSRLSPDGYLSPGEGGAQVSHSMSLSPINGEGLTPQGNRWSDSTAGNIISYFVPDNPSSCLNRSDISSSHRGTTAVSTSGSNSSPRPMLPSSASGLTPLELVHWFQTSSYVVENRLEPTDHRRRSPFLQLLRETPNRPHHYECIVPRSDGTPCAKTFNRSDRGLTHIRTHFNHRPFWCHGRCENKKW
jgi:hypothetical protein